ncbi:hypothetical protein FRB95_004460, partial [Tulasnella sp. JGI-2019a]
RQWPQRPKADIGFDRASITISDGTIISASQYLLPPSSSVKKKPASDRPYFVCWVLDITPHECDKE